MSMLSETQEQLKKQRKRAMPTARGGTLFPSLMAAPQPDSIACELESSLYSELSLDSGIVSDRMWVHDSSKIYERDLLILDFFLDQRTKKCSKQSRAYRNPRRYAPPIAINTLDWVQWQCQHCPAVPQDHACPRLYKGEEKVLVRPYPVLIQQDTVITKVLYSRIQKIIRKYYFNVFNIGLLTLLINTLWVSKDLSHTHIYFFCCLHSLQHTFHF